MFRMDEHSRLPLCSSTESTAYFLFGGAYPGQDIMPRMYITHVLLIPGLILALVTAHVFISFHQKHTAMPALGNTEHSIKGLAFYPYFLLKGTAWFFFIFAGPSATRSERCCRQGRCYAPCPRRMPTGFPRRAAPASWAGSASD
jgi:hypothetical protein